jgi:hypothetical protein
VTHIEYVLTAAGPARPFYSRHSRAHVKVGCADTRANPSHGGNDGNLRYNFEHRKRPPFKGHHTLTRRRRRHNGNAGPALPAPVRVGGTS